MYIDFSSTRRGLGSLEERLIETLAAISDIDTDTDPYTEICICIYNFTGISIGIGISNANDMDSGIDIDIVINSLTGRLASGWLSALSLPCVLV